MRALFFFALVILFAPAASATNVQSSASSDVAEPFTTSDFVFPSDNVKLSGRLYAPRGAQKFPVVLLVAGSDRGSWAEAPYTTVLARGFARQGIGSFAVDERGNGKSGGVNTNTNFQQRAGDVLAALKFIRESNVATDVGLWGLSQAGWVIPEVLKSKPDIAFTILVSIPVINPYEQVAFFTSSQIRGRGGSEQQARDAEKLYRALTLYYAGRSSYAEAKAAVQKYRSESWFEAALKDPFHGMWIDFANNGGLLPPAELEKALKDRPEDFEFYRSASTFEDYDGTYDVLMMPTLIVYGSEDDLSPIYLNRDRLERVFSENQNKNYTFMLFGGADHNQQVGPYVRGDFVESVAAWAHSRFQLRMGDRDR